MPKIIEANFIAKGKKFAVVVGRFNDFISDRLLSGAVDALLRSGAEEKDIDIVKVPGAFEIPFIAKKMANKEAYNAVICLGAVIKGSTPHFDYISAEVSKGIAQVSLDVFFKNASCIQHFLFCTVNSFNISGSCGNYN